MADFFKFEAARINRIEYLSLIFLIPAIISIAIFSPPIIITIFHINMLGKLLIAILFISALMLYVFFIVYKIILGIKRLHDLNHSGLTILFLLVPLFNIGWIFYMLCAPGTEGKNRFGKQPQPARLAHKITLFVSLFLLMITIIGLVIFGITQSTDTVSHANISNWKTCATKNFTIKFPGNYKVTKKNIAEGLTLTTRSYFNEVDKVKLDVSEANYTKAQYEKFFNDSLTAFPKKTMHSVLAIKSKAPNIKVTLDKSLHKYNLPGRELHATIKFKNNIYYYIKGIIYLDKQHHKYYMLRTYYLSDDLQDNSDKVAKQFLDSFKLLSY